MIEISWGDTYKKITVIQRSDNSLMPNSIYVQVKKGDNFVCLEESELKIIMKRIEEIKK